MGAHRTQEAAARSCVGDRRARSQPRPAPQAAPARARAPRRRRFLLRSDPCSARRRAAPARRRCRPRASCQPAAVRAVREPAISSQSWVVKTLAETNLLNKQGTRRSQSPRREKPLEKSFAGLAVFAFLVI